MSLLLVTASGEQHGLINTLANSVKDDGFKSMEPDLKKKAENQKKEDNRKVKARYINHRGNNERLSKPYCRWAGDPIQMWHLIPGHEYELPLGFINEVNASGLPRRSEVLDKNGQPTKKDGPMERIHELVPCSF